MSNRYLLEKTWAAMFSLLVSPAIMLFFIFGVNCAVSAWGDFGDLKSMLILENVALLAYFVIRILPMIALGLVLMLVLGTLTAAFPPLLLLAPVIMFALLIFKIISLFRTIIAAALGALLLCAMIFWPPEMESYLAASDQSYITHLEYSVLIGIIGAVAYFLVASLLHLTGLYGSRKGFYISAMVFAPVAITALVVLTFFCHAHHDDLAIGDVDGVGSDGQSKS